MVARRIGDGLRWRRSAGRQVQYGLDAVESRDKMDVKLKRDPWTGQMLYDDSSTPLGCTSTTVAARLDPLPPPPP